MKHYGFISRVKLIVLCLVAMFMVCIVYLALLKSPLNYQHINLGSNDLTTFSFDYVPNGTFSRKTFSDNGQFMQMVEVPDGITHRIAEVIPDGNVEYFIDLPNPNKPLIYNYNLAPLEIVPSLGLNESDTAFLNDGGFIQIYDLDDETDYIITEVLPDSNVEYFINPVESGKLNIRKLSPLENTEE